MFSVGYSTVQTLICQLYLTSFFLPPSTSSPGFFIIYFTVTFHFIGQGMLVFLDIVHSYSAADEMVGLSLFDGSNDCYFHTGKILLMPLVTFLLNDSSHLSVFSIYLPAT